MKVALGIGCDRGTPLATLARAVDEALAVAGLQRGQVTGVGSITLKADEPALLALAAQAGWPLHFYPATQLAEVVVPHPSETVRRHTGTPSVSEAAALLAAGTTEASALCVEKHRLRGGDGRNATVSVARVMPRTAIPPCVANPDPARRFTASEREAVQALMQVRRDMRHFTAGAQVAEDVRARLQSALLAAPSVGLMQPLRVLRITDPVLRDRLAAAVDQERMRTAQALGPRSCSWASAPAAPST
jgi:5,6-dimethylbenzimidazole synthase